MAVPLAAVRRLALAARPATARRALRTVAHTGAVLGAGSAPLSARLRPVQAWAQSRYVSVSAEPTPNPDSVMFHPASRDVLGQGTKTIKFTNKYDTADSPLAAAIFKVKGVSEVLLAPQHVTVTKTPSVDWDLVQPNIELVIGQFYAAGLKVVKDGVAERDVATSWEPGSIEAQIVELLEERVRPFVMQDGGDVEFHHFDHDGGIVHLRMHGACAGCPKSNVTLQHGIKNLMEHYIPEVKDVVPVEEEDGIPRPH
mmetsp:Transcript_109731/g.305294  ORF Transcript_109731/g.305294 Transcript_109731/m.305294 type:complete len:255 (+) Transcript_109731:2-766(+)